MIGIVRSADDYTGVSGQHAREKSNSRCSDDPGRLNLGARAERAVNQISFDLVAGLACVAAGDDSRSTPAGSFSEMPGERASDSANRGRLQRKLAGFAANAIRAEKLSGVFRLQFGSWNSGFQGLDGGDFISFSFRARPLRQLTRRHLRVTAFDRLEDCRPEPSRVERAPDLSRQHDRHQTCFFRDYDPRGISTVSDAHGRPRPGA